jgi:2'-5' RNA ligase
VSAEQSALVVTVPNAEPTVASLRARLDSRAALGVPAHITILYPFMAPAQLSTVVVAELSGLFGSSEQFEITLASIGWFGREVLYLRPEPDEPLRQLTALLNQRWPNWPPTRVTSMTRHHTSPSATPAV